MTIFITKQTIVDGERNLVVKTILIGDNGSDVTDTLLIDASDYSGSFTDLKIMKIQAHLNGFSLMLEWDANTNVDALSIPGDEWVNYNFFAEGGLPNNAGTGKTGDIDIDTSGMGTGEAGSIVFWLRKS
jgi:hypothetical protein